MTVNVAVKKILPSERVSTDITNMCESCGGIVFAANVSFVPLFAFMASKAFLRRAGSQAKVEVDMLLIRKLTLAAL